MIIYGEGNPVNEVEQFMKDRRKSVGRIENSFINFHQSPDYIDSELNVPHGRDRKRFRFFGDSRTQLQGQFQGKNAVKRHKVSLTHYPRKNSRRKEENSLIMQQNFHPANLDINGRRSSKSDLHIARHQNGHEAQYRTIHSPGNYKQRRDWCLKSNCNNDQDEIEHEYGSYNLLEPCSKPCQIDNLIPGTYMVQIDSVWDGEYDIKDDTSKSIKRRQSENSKCFYIFEKQPFKVKFLSYVPKESYENCTSSPSPCAPSPPCELPSSNSPSPQPILIPYPNDISVKMTLPPFQCIPPDCREVLYCKYFQCTSLGYFPDSRNCRKYFFCDINSNGLVLYHMLCPEGRIFDPFIRECRLKEMMNEKDVQECRVEAAKIRRNQKMRIKKNDKEDLIKYKIQPKIKFRHERMKNIVNYSPNERWKRRRSSKISDEELEKRKNIMMQKLEARKILRKSNAADSWMYPNYRRKSFMMIPTQEPYSNDSGTFLPSDYCEMSLNIQTSSTTTTTSSSMTTTEIKSTSTTPSTPKTTTTTTVKTTLPICPPFVTKKKPCLSCKNQKTDLGELESDAYQDDMQDYYYDNYYDGDYPENFRENDYEWLRQGLNEYLEGIKLKKGKVDKEKKEDKIKPDEGHNTTTQENVTGITENANEKEKDSPKLSKDLTEITLIDDSDRGKRSREKSLINRNTTKQNDSIIYHDLPDFEKSYNEEKLSNLDGYPCKKYARYPDKFDNVCYYECGVQPDGNMRIEHKCCSKGEEFSPIFLECVGTEYLKVAHKKRSASEYKKKNKQPTNKQEQDDEERAFPNEWLDASHIDQIPNEFKSKNKNALRIFHLHCGQDGQNSTSTQPYQQLKKDLQGHSHKHEVRSFKIRNNKKELKNDLVKTTDSEEDEYDEEDYEEEDGYDEGQDNYEHETSTPEMESTTDKMSSIKSSSPEIISQLSTTSKVLLDADIHVGRDFENALKNILGNAQEKNQKRNSKDSILIRLSGNRPIRRRKRNFFKGTFVKKKDNGDMPAKERLVSMMTLINGLASDYDKELLLQKLERRKMMNSQILRVKRKRKKADYEKYTQKDT